MVKQARIIRKKRNTENAKVSIYSKKVRKDWYAPYSAGWGYFLSC